MYSEPTNGQENVKRALSSVYLTSNVANICVYTYSSTRWLYKRISVENKH